MDALARKILTRIVVVNKLQTSHGSCVTGVHCSQLQSNENNWNTGLYQQQSNTCREHFQNAEYPISPQFLKVLLKSINYQICRHGGKPGYRPTILYEVILVAIRYNCTEFALDWKIKDISKQYFHNPIRMYPYMTFLQLPVTLSCFVKK